MWDYHYCPEDVDLPPGKFVVFTDETTSLGRRDVKEYLIPSEWWVYETKGNTHLPVMKVSFCPYCGEKLDG